MMTKSAVNVASIVGYNHCHMPRHKIKDTLVEYLGNSSSCGFHILPMLIWCSSGRCILGQLLCKHGSHVFDWRLIGKTSRLRKQFNLIGKEEIEHPVWLRIILLEYV
ncbi:hypothetical protein TNCV_3534891 [Trichonephila clavipes]|nr:hypothetical protein TNCV_3534891 [Trichonephila clavipes]